MITVIGFLSSALFLFAAGVRCGPFIERGATIYLLPVPVLALLYEANRYNLTAVVVFLRWRVGLIYWIK